MNVIIIVVALSLGGFLAFSRQLGKSSYWKAMVTPLASIMGSGFLVSAPLLGATVGNLAIVCMAVLLVLAYAVGGAIRFNIQHFEPIESGTGPAQDVAFVSRVVLVGAYFISVTYYLQLLAAFALKALGLNDQVASHLVTSSLLVSICSVGVWRGLGMLENLEKYTVALNLGMIGALLVALAAYNAQLLTEARWHLSAIPGGIDVHGARVLLGLLIIVQGFETSRYLGDEHSAAERISTMRAAQVVSSVIYLLFIGLAAVLFRQGMGAADVTGIIDMTRPVALVLPLLLSLAAIGSQFSASVADSEGAGGLIEDITHHRLRIRYAYLLIMLVTVTITWETNVNQIIAYASRAFALYYMWQCVVAFIVARRMKQLPHRRFRLATFALLSLVCLLVFALGVPSG